MSAPSAKAGEIGEKCEVGEGIDAPDAIDWSELDDFRGGILTVRLEVEVDLGSAISAVEKDARWAGADLGTGGVSGSGAALLGGTMSKRTGVADLPREALYDCGREGGGDGTGFEPGKPPNSAGADDLRALIEPFDEER